MVHASTTGLGVKILLACVAALLTACGSAESDLVVSGAWARPAEVSDSSAMGGSVSAVYMTVENHSGRADRLTGAKTDVADMVELHETRMVDGVMQMRPVSGGIEVPAQGQVSLEPGGYHIMLMGLRQDLAEGNRIRVTLIFESGKEIAVEALVQAAPPGE